MSIHFATTEDKYEQQSGGTTPGHDDDVFSVSSDADTKSSKHHLSQYHQPQSLAERLYSDVRNSAPVQAAGKPQPKAHTKVALGKIGRASSFSEPPAAPPSSSSSTKSRRGRLTHANIHFQSIQSEPGRATSAGRDRFSTESRDSITAKQTQSDASFCRPGGVYDSSKPDSSLPSLGGFGAIKTRSAVGSDPTFVTAIPLDKNTTCKLQSDRSQSHHMSFENNIENDTYV